MQNQILGVFVVRITQSDIKSNLATADIVRAEHMKSLI